MQNLLPLLLTLLGGWFLWSVASTAIALVPQLLVSRKGRVAGPAAFSIRRTGRGRRRLRRAA